VQIGFYVTGSKGCGYADLIEQVDLAERSGLHSVWLRERHFHRDHEGRNFFSSPFVTAAYLAARTKRIRIGVGARILPLDHPIHIAEGAATVDRISGGRLDVGVARIGENELYQHAFGTSEAQARGRFEESLEVLLRAWTGEPFSYEGKHYRVPTVSVRPTPEQRPHPPVYLVGLSRATLRFGAARAMPLLLAGASPVRALRETQMGYRALLADSGHDPLTVAMPVNRFIYVAETNARAVEETKTTVMEFIERRGSVIRDFLSMNGAEPTYERLFEEVFIIGDPDFCRQRIRALAEQVDVRDLILTFNYFTIPHERCRASMERFVDQVMPGLAPEPAVR
jgi:alkanesulfonate monooxygenase SsuD/methylene tetrahydromethanopterin reductase-like flavin-dependent oxidoreductase (luciferase family)